MECIHLTFDHFKSTQAINYFALKDGGKVDKVKVIKLIFFADRFHLRKYGRLVTNDNYVAMKFGPVSSGTKDIIDANSSFIDPDIIEYSSEYLSRDGYNIISEKSVDLNVFSESDIEALEFAWNEFGKYNELTLKDLTHHYPEWQKHESAINSGIKQIPMDFKDFFEDPKPQFNPCYNMDNDEKEINIASLIERSHAKAAWD